jgi:DNA-directed RNA polymerase subunit E'/Rpb7
VRSVMFYQVPLERQVDVEPRMFGPNLENNIKEKVRQQVRTTEAALLSVHG